MKFTVIMCAFSYTKNLGHPVLMNKTMIVCRLTILFLVMSIIRPVTLPIVILFESEI